MFLKIGRTRNNQPGGYGPPSPPTERNKMKLKKTKWYIAKMDEGIIAGPFNTKNAAKWDFSIMGQETKRDLVYDSMYETETGAILATGKTMEVAGFSHYA